MSISRPGAHCDWAGQPQRLGQEPVNAELSHRLAGQVLRVIFSPQCRSTSWAVLLVVTIDGRDHVWVRCASAGWRKPHIERQVGMFEPMPTGTRSRHHSWAVLNSTSFIGSWVGMTKRRLVGAKLFPQPISRGRARVHRLHFPRDPWSDPDLRDGTDLDRDGTTHPSYAAHQLLRHQSLANLAMEHAVAPRPANTRDSAAVRPGG